MVESGCEGGNNNQDEYTKKKRALFLFDHVNEYNDIARTSKDVRNHLRNSVVTWWRRGDGDMAECHEEKGDMFFDFADFHGKEAAKASKELHRIIGSSDPMLSSRPLA